MADGYANVEEIEDSRDRISWEKNLGIKLKAGKCGRSISKEIKVGVGNVRL